MRLPASVLGTLRLGLGATALVAFGCDAETEGARELEPVTTSAPAQLEAALNAPEVAAQVIGLVERTVEEAPEPTRRAAREFASASGPVVAQASEDLTAFVPFAESPTDAQPIRPRIRSRVQPRPRARPRPVEAGSSWSAPPRPKWDGDNCPACGRG